MDKGSPGNLLDLDIIDDLILDGCWLEANGLEFPYFSSPNFVSTLEQQLDTDATIADFSMTPSKGFQNENQTSSSPENKQLAGGSKSITNDNSVGMFAEHEDSLESAEPSKRWWIGPRPSTPVMERLIQALGCLQKCLADRDALIQIWAPVNREGKRVLTTDDQPYSLDFNCASLAHYREVSVSYQFSTDEDYKGIVGLPGRVFRSKVPEWTPDVRFFTWDEYPRIDHALKYDVRGTLLVPVLEQGNKACLGVIEVVLTKQKIQYRPELLTVCKALEAVNLRTAELSRFENGKTTSDLSYQAALPEIYDVLGSVCTSHKLPLAQTWVSCILQGKEGCRHSDENVNNCVSPVDSACYIFDPLIQGFHEACSEYHLLKGLGVVGKAFETNQPCYSSDVTSCSITEYPLSHYARIFGLKAAVAIRLRSTSTGLADFVLEFFLPVKCGEAEEQRKLLSSLSTTMQNACRTLRVVTDEELQQEAGIANNASTSAFKCIGSSRDPSLKPALMHHEDCGLVTPNIMTFTSAPDGLLSTSRAREKRRSKAEKTITLQELKQHFSGTLKDAATHLGVCPTTLKRICRQHGIRRWPCRTIKKVGHSLQKIQRVIDSVQGASSLVKMEPVYSNFSKLASPCKPGTASLDEKVDINTSRHAAAFPSPSTSRSYSSSSRRSCSIEVHPARAHSSSPVSHKDNQEEPSTSKENLHMIKDGPKLIPSSLHKPESLIPAAEKAGLRMKVSYRTDTIRLRVQNHWKYLDLLQEVSKRFKVEDATDFHLKYLDDDGEWILLTCDADLEECIDLCRLSPRQTIKLLFHEICHVNSASIEHQP